MDQQERERQLRLGLARAAERIDVDLVRSRNRLERSRQRPGRRPHGAVLAAVATASIVVAIAVGLPTLLNDSGRSRSSSSQSPEGQEGRTPNDRRHPRLQGIPVAGRTHNGRVEYVLHTAGGDAFTISLPSALAWTSTATAAPDPSLAVNGEASSPRSWLTVASATEVAAAECAAYAHDTGDTCQPHVVATRIAASDSVMTHWRVGGGELTTTVTNNGWTLVLQGPRQDLAETIAAGIAWTVGGGGFPELKPIDPRVVTGQQSTTLRIGDGVTADELLNLSVAAGCSADTRANPRSALQLTDARHGSWCIGSTYHVEVVTPAQTNAPTPRQMYEQLQVRSGT